MAAELISLSSEGDPRAAVQRAAKALAEGALVAFPTETVYGLAANAANEDAIRRLRAARDDSTDQPYTVHLARREGCEAFVPQLPAIGRRFMKKGWPGPLTLVFQVNDPSRSDIYSSLGNAGRASVYGAGHVGLRCPDHPIAAELIGAASAPIVATGANAPGHPAPFDASGVHRQIGASIDFVLDAGPTRYKKPSSIVAINGEGYRLIRAGVLDERSIKRLANVNILFVCTGNTCRSPMAEGLFKKMVAEKLGCAVGDLPRRGIHIRSAGTMAFGGGGASREAVEVGRRRGFDLTHHAARTVDPELIHTADYIFTMGRHHIDVLHSISPTDGRRAQPLESESDISDPAGSSLDEYERVADRITAALHRRLEEVTL